jgi:hypothetical protein
MDVQTTSSSAWVVAAGYALDARDGAITGLVAAHRAVKARCSPPLVAESARLAGSTLAVFLPIVCELRRPVVGIPPHRTSVTNEG